jgi:hypothetical protein
VNKIFEVAVAVIGQVISARRLCLCRLRASTSSHLIYPHFKSRCARSAAPNPPDRCQPESTPQVGGSAHAPPLPPAKHPVNDLPAANSAPSPPSFAVYRGADPRLRIQRSLVLLVCFSQRLRRQRTPFEFPSAPREKPNGSQSIARELLGERSR